MVAVPLRPQLRVPPTGPIVKYPNESGKVLTVQSDGTVSPDLPKRVNPPYVYGNLAVAKLLWNAGEIWHVGLVGDSRSALTNNNYPGSVAYAGLLGGQNEGANWLGLGGLATTTLYSPSNIGANVPTPIGDLGTVSFNSLVYTVLAAGNAPGGYAQARLYYSPSIVDVTSLLAVVPQVTGTLVTMKALFRVNNTGLTTSDLHISARKDPDATPNFNGSVLKTYSPAPGWIVGSVDIPNTWNWTVNSKIELECWYTQGAAVRAGESIALVDVWFESRGISVLNWAAAGRGLPHYLDPVLYADELWSELFPVYGANRALWIDLGTNNTLGWNTAQQAQGLRDLIARFRTGTPGGPVILSTAYAGGSDLPNVSPYYRDAAIEVSESDALAICLDTQMALPTYSQAVVNGYYDPGDSTHYNATGQTAFAKMRWQLLASAATQP